MLFKWFAIGAVIGGTLFAIAGSSFWVGAFMFGGTFYGIRKWFFMTFWK